MRGRRRDIGTASAEDAVVPPGAVVGGPGNAALARLLGGGERAAPAVARSAPTTQGAGPLDPQIAAGIDARRGSGAALPDGTRATMEQHFGVDFGTVRVHTDHQADTLSRSVQAEAFTTGRDIFFRSGNFDPGSSAGQERIAHELTHVVQQSSGSAGAAGTVSSPHDPAEREAARSAGAFVRSAGPAGNTVVARLAAGGAGPVMRQAVANDNNGGNGCYDPLQAIIELLNEVAKRFNDALDDPHGLFDFHRRLRDAHPDFGSWDGHRDRFNYDRGRLRLKLAEWDSNDDCRGRQLSPQQEADLNEAREFAEREYPVRPVARERTVEPDPGLRDRIRQTLIDYGVPAVAVGALVGLIIVALADPEPFSKVAMLVGAAAAVGLFVLFGRADEVPSSAGPTARADDRSAGSPTA